MGFRTYCARTTSKLSPRHALVLARGAPKLSKAAKQLGEAPTSHRKPHIVREPLAPLTLPWQKASSNLQAVTLAPVLLLPVMGAKHQACRGGIATPRACRLQRCLTKEASDYLSPNGMYTHEGPRAGKLRGGDAINASAEQRRYGCVRRVVAVSQCCDLMQGRLRRLLEFKSV